MVKGRDSILLCPFNLADYASHRLQIDLELALQDDSSRESPFNLEISASRIVLHRFASPRSPPLWSRKHNHRELLNENRAQAGPGRVAGAQGGVQPQRRGGEIHRQRQDKAGDSGDAGRTYSPFYNFLSDEERRLFTTKPKEVTA